MTLSYSKDTSLVCVTVIPEYEGYANTSDPYTRVWKYRVAIKNNSSKQIQVLSRHWSIVESSGFKKEVAGDGVVGVQPIISPGSTFEYTSNASLKTGSGVMYGRYKVLTLEDGSTADIDIPLFVLESAPRNAVSVH